MWKNHSQSSYNTSDEDLIVGNTIRFTHFPSFRSYVGIFLGVEKLNEKYTWKFVTENGVERENLSSLTNFKLELFLETR